MAEPLRPNAVATHGKKNWILVDAIASASLIPVATTEVGAASSLDVTRIMVANGTARPSQTTNRVTAERRLGDTTTNEFIGDTSFQGGDWVYAFDPQAATGSNGKKLFEKIGSGYTGFLVERMGVGRATAPAAGQFVNVYPISIGPSMPVEAGQDESSEAAMTCTVAVTNQPALSVALT